MTGMGNRPRNNMNKNDQTATLKDIIARVQANLLAHSSQWPEDWDGYELRWLVAAAFAWERDSAQKRDRRRYAALNQVKLTTKLY